MGLGYKLGDFPESEKAQNEVLSLPFEVDVTIEYAIQVSDSIKDYYA